MDPKQLILWVLAITGSMSAAAITLLIVVSVARAIRDPFSRRRFK